MSGNTPTQNTRKNVGHWIGISPLDAGDIKPPGVINKRLIDYEASVTIMRHVKPHSHTCKSKNLLILSLKIKTPLFLLGGEGKTGVLRGYCGGKGPKKFIGPWALFEDMDRSKKGSK